MKHKDNCYLLWSKKGTISERQKLRCRDFENTDKAVYTWLISKRSQQIPTNDEKILKEEALEFVKFLRETEISN